MKLAYGAIAALSTWGLLAAGLAPYLIRLGYREEGFGILSDVFSGRSELSLDFYLEAWRSTALTETTVLVAVLGLHFLRRETKLADTLNGFRAVDRAAASSVGLPENRPTIEHEMVMKMLCGGAG